MPDLTVEEAVRELDGWKIAAANVLADNAHQRLYLLAQFDKEVASLIAAVREEERGMTMDDCRRAVAMTAHQGRDKDGQPCECEFCHAVECAWHSIGAAANEDEWKRWNTGCTCGPYEYGSGAAHEFCDHCKRKP